MNRFYYTPGQFNNGLVSLSGEDARHLSRVLRSSVGDAVELCDEAGSCYLAEITAIDKERVLCRLGAKMPAHEPGVAITLAFGMVKGEKAGFIFQKATELGVAAFMPFYSGRTVKREKNSETKMERWRRILRAAAAQSRRDIVPALSLPCDWEELVKSFSLFDRVVLFWESETDKPLSEALHDLPERAKILLITGPEGGFSRHEAAIAVEQGARVVTLGPRILRAETAAVVAAALSLYEAGEMGGGK